MICFWKYAFGKLRIRTIKTAHSSVFIRLCIIKSITSTVINSQWWVAESCIPPHFRNKGCFLPTSIPQPCFKHFSLTELHNLLEEHNTALVSYYKDFLNVLNILTNIAVWIHWHVAFFRNPSVSALLGVRLWTFLFDIFSSFIQNLETFLNSCFLVYIIKVMLLAWAAALSRLFIWIPLTFSTICQRPDFSW